MYQQGTLFEESLQTDQPSVDVARYVPMTGPIPKLATAAMTHIPNAHILALASHMSSRDPQATVLGRALANPERKRPTTTPAT